MVHPDAGDAVAVCNEIAIPLADDGGVGAVDPHAAKVLFDHLPHAGRVHQKQGQAVLPQIAPAPAAPAVVVMGQEGAAEQPPQKRLEADPSHQAVKVPVAGGKADVHLFQPGGAGALQSSGGLFRAAVPLPDGADVRLAVLHAQHQDVLDLLAGRQSHRREAEGAHSFPSLCGAAGRRAGQRLKYGPRMQVGAALPQKGFHRGEKRLRLLAAGAAAPHVIDPVVGAVAPLVEGHGGADQHAVPGGPDAVQHGGDVAVVPDVVRAASVEGNGRGGRHPAGLVRLVAHRDQQDLRTVVRGAEGGDRGVQPHGLPAALQGVPHQAGGHRAVILVRGETGGLLPGRSACRRKDLAFRPGQPEVAPRPVVVQVFGADRLQQKAVLVQLGVASQRRGDGAFHPGFRGQRKVQIADIFGPADGKAAVPVHKVQMVQ